MSKTYITKYEKNDIYNYLMKTSLYIFSIILCIVSCNGNKVDDVSLKIANEPRTVITLTQVEKGSIGQTVTLPATTAFLSRSVVSAPISAFITKAHVTQGMRVSAGGVLYELESKEQHAIGNGAPICIKAERSGIVLDVMQQTGGYVTEGEILCTIADASSLVFEIDVPYEQQHLVRAGSHCKIELPDGRCYSATISAPLASANAEAQTERFIARAKVPFLPEGLNVKAIFSKPSVTKKSTWVLAKNAIQSDETLSNFWVMKLNADSTVSKVFVEVGNSNEQLAEIVSNNIKLNDKIVLTGGYGLEDGAKVVVKK